MGGEGRYAMGVDHVGCGLVRWLQRDAGKGVE